MTNLSIISVNCNGLGDREKRTDVFNYWKTQNPNIIFLQDIRIDPDMEDAVRNEWGQEAIIGAYRSNARGVAILFNNFDFKIQKVKKRH